MIWKPFDMTKVDCDASWLAFIATCCTPKKLNNSTDRNIIYVYEYIETNAIETWNLSIENPFWRYMNGIYR